MHVKDTYISQVFALLLQSIDIPICIYFYFWWKESLSVDVLLGSLFDLITSLSFYKVSIDHNVTSHGFGYQ